MFIHLVISVILLLALPAEKSEYVSKNGERFNVEKVRLPTEDKAYEAFSLAAAEARSQNPGLEIRNEIGTAAFTAGDQIAFAKGLYFVRITATKLKSTNLSAAAQSVSDGLEKGEGDIPVLIKHLPNPDDAQKNAIFLNNINALTSLAQQYPVLNAVQANGNADAAFATVGASKVLIVEFLTPQLATDNDQRIVARIHELWNLGQSAPTAYRRVGNYSVFVFDAPDEQTAKQLIDQVKYEQVVQWLGDNPNILKEAEQRYINTTLGVLVAVLKASGYAAVACFGLGGLIGALLFSYRRGQQKTRAAYSDAGGMMRLNLDDLSEGSKK